MLETKRDFHIHYQNIISKAHKMLGWRLTTILKL